MNTFSELKLSASLQVALARHGFVTPTPVQAKTIPLVLAGRDLVATAQTGTGKTLAFVLPILQALTTQPSSQGISALILTPTRELAMQIHEAYTQLAQGTGIRAAVVVGGLSEQTQLRAIRNGARVIIATPGRLSDFLNRRLIKLSSAGIFVLDEADRMLDMGFLPTVKTIMETLPKKRQTLFFSATIESSVANLINTHLTNPERVSIGSATQPNDHVDLHVYEVEQDRKLGLLHFILDEHEGSFLVFARTKHGADRLAKKLKIGGIKATAIHGNRTQNQRTQALRGFQSGEYRVLVATDVAARGIHVDGIAHVVNYDLPQVPEDFIHRVGRTGRAGSRGTASTFGTRLERAGIRKIERALKVQLTRREVSTHLASERKTMTVVSTDTHAVAPQGFAKPYNNSGRSRNGSAPKPVGGRLGRRLKSRGSGDFKPKRGTPFHSLNRPN